MYVRLLNQKGRLYYCAGINTNGVFPSGDVDLYTYRYALNKTECLGISNTNVTLTNVDGGTYTIMTGFTGRSKGNGVNGVNGKEKEEKEDKEGINKDKKYKYNVYTHAPESENTENTENTERNITQSLSGSGSIEWTAHDVNRTWINHRQHFDNIGASMLTLFEVTSLEMWPEIFASTVDAPDTWDDHPSYMVNILPALYFVPVVMICSLLVANLFVAAVVETFADIMASEDGSYLVTPAQQAWADVMHIMISDKPALPMEHRTGPVWKQQLGLFMELETTELIVFVLIASNVFTMSMYYWSPLPPSLASSSYTLALEVFNVFFVWIFFIEAVLKIVGWGFRQYWQSAWNRFDFVIVVLTTFGWILITSGVSTFQYTGLTTMNGVIK